MSKYREAFRRRERLQKRFEQRIEESCRKSGHGRPRSRREFLNQGLISGAATVFQGRQHGDGVVTRRNIVVVGAEWPGGLAVRPSGETASPR